MALECQLKCSALCIWPFFDHLLPYRMVSLDCFDSFCFHLLCISKSGVVFEDHLVDSMLFYQCKVVRFMCDPAWTKQWPCWWCWYDENSTLFNKEFNISPKVGVKLLAGEWHSYLKCCHDIITVKCQLNNTISINAPRFWLLFICFDLTAIGALANWTIR